MEAKTITFEQPLNEHIRVCLRLEHLFQEVDHNLKNDSIWSSRTALTAILGILNVIDRPDLKTKLTTALTNHATNLSQLEKMPNVDREKLHHILQELDQLIDKLHALHGKLGQQLREDEFLTPIRQRLGNPGGACNFSAPAYQLWLKQPAKERMKELSTWYKEFDQLKSIVQLLLQLTRDSNLPQVKTSENGFYQEALDATVSWQLIRVTVPLALNVYPEISVGRHRLSIRFFTQNIHEHAKQSTQNIEFQLTRCTG